MEFCPEIAVFQSALQLVDKQTNSQLSTLSKDECQHFLKIIKTAVTEICDGLEKDNSEKEAEAWNQKLNALCLYSVIVNNYREPEEKQPCRVPLCSSLDIITGMLPKFGSTLYFEVVKTCSWSPYFFECLEYIDRETALNILNDYLQHSACEPVDLQDTEVISIVTDKILASCLNLPVVTETNISNLLLPVTNQKKFVQIMFPDNLDMGKETSKREEVNEDGMGAKTYKEPLWNCFVVSKPEVVLHMLVAFETFLEKEEKNDAEKGEIIELFCKGSRIFLFWYLHILGDDQQEVCFDDDWFVNNFFVRKNPDVNSEAVSQDKIQTSYCINVPLVQKISDMKYRDRLMGIVEQAVELICKHCSNLTVHTGDSKSNAKAVTKEIFDQTGDSGTKATTKETSKVGCEVSDDCNVNTNKTLVELDFIALKNNIGDDICVLKTKEDSLFVKTLMLLRMVADTFNNKTEGDGRLSLVENGSHDDKTSKNSTVCFGSDWTKDVTLDALLWRIEHRLYKYDGCLQILMSEPCWSFWICQRVLDLMKKESAVLLTKKSHVTKCVDILGYLMEQSTDTQVHDMRDVVCTSFCGLTTQDKDALVAAMYREDGVDLKKMMGYDTADGFTRQIVNVFNKVTADVDKQILDQIFLLCLMDPWSVLDTVIYWSLKSEDQANNLAKVFSYMPETCQTTHPLHHIDSSLIVTMINKFLTSTQPSEKEERHFVVFIETLMMKSSKSPALPPAELIRTCLLDAVDSSNFTNCCHPIRCGFALSLLTLAIESGCNMSCDWLNQEFEPAVLLASLAGILHECTEIWGQDLDISSKSEEADLAAMVTGYQKIDMKEKALGCINLIVDMLQDGTMKGLDNVTVYWLQEVTDHLNWVVRLTMANCLYRLGHIQTLAQWLELFDSLVTDITEHLPVILLMCVMDERFIDNINTKYGDGTSIVYEDLIAALVQIIPNLLAEEMTKLTNVLEILIEKGLITMYYRSTSMSAIVLTDLTVVKPILCLSQILRDVILTMSVVEGHDGGQQRKMLKHVMQNYSTVVKTKCQGNLPTVELQLFTLSQIFHHVCVVTETLPPNCVDNGLVLLLHLLTKFKDITMVTKDVKVKAKRKEVVPIKVGSNVKMVKNIENGMKIAVEQLSDDFEEKHMLLKKLSET